MLRMCGVVHKWDNPDWIMALFFGLKPLKSCKTFPIDSEAADHSPFRRCSLPGCRGGRCGCTGGGCRAFPASPFSMRSPHPPSQPSVDPTTSCFSGARHPLVEGGSQLKNIYLAEM